MAEANQARLLNLQVLIIYYSTFALTEASHRLSLGGFNFTSSRGKIALPRQAARFQRYH